MAIPVPTTVRDQIVWSYANLARAHAALEDGVAKYKMVHHIIIGNKMYLGLPSGKIAMRSLYDDERLRLTASQACYYCGHWDNLTVDHLVPLVSGRLDEADNLIWACQSCNSSKSGRVLLIWVNSTGFSPQYYYCGVASRLLLGIGKRMGKWMLTLSKLRKRTPHWISTCCRPNCLPWPNYNTSWRKPIYGAHHDHFNGFQ